jgi:L-fuconolactonase
LVRPVLAAEFDAVADANGVDAAVAVEAASAGADPVAETEWLLAETGRSTVTQRVVAYAPVESLDIETRLDRLTRDPRVVGVRRTFESVPDGFILSEAVQAGIRAVARRGLSFDLVLFSDRLRDAGELVRRLPEVQFVLDHLGKPPITEAVSLQWRDDLAAIAQCPNVTAKLSGLITEAPGGWDDEMLRPYADTAIAAFGWNRLMFGSDWPICELAGGYARWLAFTRSLVPDPADAAQFFAGTASRVYRF